MPIDTVDYGGWPNCVRLANKEVEAVVTQVVGPRIIRFGFVGGRNVLGELPSQIGGANEDEWMLRGGHRLWLSPEAKPWSYELDNTPVTVEELPTGGILTTQPPGPITGVVKNMEISLAPDRNELTVSHRLTNAGTKPVGLAPWALTVMAKNGLAVIPLPKKIAHAERLTHNQQWSIWGYTDFTDRRWTIGSRYLTLRQDPARPATKLGVAHREGWVAYLIDGYLFVKRFTRNDEATYPDAGVNFETFANEDILELESLGPLETLEPGQSASHVETWSLHRGLPDCATETDLDKHVAPLAEPHT